MWRKCTPNFFHFLALLMSVSITCVLTSLYHLFYLVSPLQKCLQVNLNVKLVTIKIPQSAVIK